jgi:rubrerythrin
MPHFDENGYETWICQVCKRVYNTTVHPEWRPDITGHPSAGNVCPSCIAKHDNEK